MTHKLKLQQVTFILSARLLLYSKWGKVGHVSVGGVHSLIIVVLCHIGYSYDSKFISNILNYGNVLKVYVAKIHFACSFPVNFYRKKQLLKQL